MLYLAANTFNPSTMIFIFLSAPVALWLLQRRLEARAAGETGRKEIALLLGWLIFYLATLRSPKIGGMPNYLVALILLTLASIILNLIWRKKTGRTQRSYEKGLRDVIRERQQNSSKAVSDDEDGEEPESKA